jgi:hypothetical protein
LPFALSGGNAQPFDNQTTPQLDAFQGHTHPYIRKTDSGHYLDSGSHTGVVGGSTWQETRVPETSISPYGEPRIANETRPLNYTVKIWKRVA